MNAQDKKINKKGQKFKLPHFFAAKYLMHKKKNYYCQFEKFTKMLQKNVSK